MTLSYLELKEIIYKMDQILPVDVYCAESIARVYRIHSPYAKIWLMFLFSSQRQGELFFCPKEDVKFKQLQLCLPETALPTFEEELKEFIQGENSVIIKPILQIDERFCLPRAYEEAFGWVKDFVELMQDNQSIKYESIEDPLLSVEQNEALQEFFAQKWLILTGGPGRGKTFTAKKMVKSYLQCFPQAKIIGAAPTGKAAENLAQVINSMFSTVLIQPKTIHNLLGISPLKMSVDIDDKLDVDLLIIDECSMIDFTLFSLLLKKIHNKTKVLLIGDENQLPPVQGLSPFKLLLELAPLIENIAVKKLTIPFRTDQEHLIQITDAILENSSEKIRSTFQSSALQIYPLEKLKIALEKELHEFIHEKNAGFEEKKLFKNKVITSHNIGSFGADEINRYCFELVKKIPYNSTVLLPIIFNENDDRLGIYNGKMAYYAFFDETPLIYLQNQETIAPYLVPKFELAFAISIHKSQGSEFENVWLSLQQFNPLSKELLYTAVSRAKKSLIIFGQEEALYNLQSEVDQNWEMYKKMCLKKIEQSTLKLA